MTVYDSQTAARFVAESTGLPYDTAWAVIEAQWMYESAMLGHASPEDQDRVDAIVAKYPRLFAQDGLTLVTWDREAEFVRTATQIEPKLIAALLGAEAAYRVKLGIVPAGYEAEYRAWARGWTASTGERLN